MSASPPHCAPLLCIEWRALDVHLNRICRTNIHLIHKLCKRSWMHPIYFPIWNVNIQFIKSLLYYHIQEPVRSVGVTVECGRGCHVYSLLYPELAKWLSGCWVCCSGMLWLLLVGRDREAFRVGLWQFTSSLCSCHLSRGSDRGSFTAVSYEFIVGWYAFILLFISYQEVLLL